MTITTYHGDCTAILPALPARSVQCCVASPPYLGLRQYKGVVPTDWPEIAYTPMAGLPPVVVPAMACCLGDEQDPLAYVGHLVHVFRLVWRVLRDDGTVWLNLGDSYAQDSKWGGAPSNKNYTSALGNIPRSQRRTGVPDKNALLIPSRTAFALQADGWLLRNDVIWHKPNPMPSSASDRLTVSHEHVFLLAKQPRYYFDQATIAEQAVGKAQGQAAMFRRDASSRGSALVPGNTASHRTDRPMVEYNGMTRNARDVWTIPTQPYPGAHFAVFPEALPRRCILAGSSPQACEHCGSPWRRVLARGEPDPTRLQARRALERWREAGLTEAHLYAIRAVGLADTGQAQHTMHGSGANTPEMQRLAAEAKQALGGYYREFLFGGKQTTGWQPTCRCDPCQGTGRSVVLDPFAGSGTTLRVAEQVGRDSIGIELGDYADLIDQRTRGIQTELFAEETT